MSDSTMQLARSRWQWIDAYIRDAAGAPVLGLTSANFTLRYKKNNVTVFTTKTLGGFTTTVATGVVAGVTSVALVDASVFPLSGSLVLDPGGANEETVTYTAIPNYDTITVSTTTNPHIAGEIVRLVDFVAVGVGVYTFLYSDLELDTVGQFTAVFTPSAGLQVVKDIDIIYSEALGSDPPASLPVCRLYGYVIDLAGNPYPNIGVSARLLATPNVVSGQSVQKDTVATETDANGYFMLLVLQGATVDIAIPATDYRRTIVVPDDDSANLFSIA